jgi:uncharacterized membrane protein YqjE
MGATALSLLRLRVELAAIELKEGTERRRKMIVAGATAAVFLASSLLLLAVLVVVFFWDSYRMPALCAVTLVYSGVGTWAYLRFRAEMRDIPPPFSATLGEFQKDLDMLRGHDGET